MTSLYIGFPNNCFLDGSNDIGATVARLDDAFPDVTIKHVVYDDSYSLNILNFSSMVGQKPGPVLLLQPLKATVLDRIRVRLAVTVPVAVPTISSEAELHEAVTSVIDHFTNGEPLVAIDIIVALLVMAKLEANHMWAGNSKGYMWAADIPKGRGVDEKYKNRTPHVLNVLYQHDLLVKKPSQGKSKFALNDQCRTNIYEVLRDRKLPREVERLLQRHPTLESVRSLDVLPDYEASR